MDPAQFDRLIARAQNPRLIPGIYNYCDGRCPRCPFTDRCLTYLDCQEEPARDANTDTPFAGMIGESLRRTIEMIAEIAGRDGLDLEAPGGDDAADAAAIDAAFERHQQDPLVVQAREYGHLAWRIAKALEPLAVARGDPRVADAVETIEWFSSLVGAKLYRAVAGQAEGWETDEEVRPDHDGSAKVALIGIAQSRDGWRVLMEEGKATADGVPAQAVRMLDALEAGIRKRFPNAMAFVRPGFDEPEGAT